MALVYFRSPPWFFGLDSLLETIIVITAFMVSFYSYKIFTILHNKRHKYFSIAFFLIGFAYFFKIISSLVLHPDIKSSLHALMMTMIPQFSTVDIIHFYSFLLFKLLTVWGFMMLFFIAIDIKRKAVVIVTAYLSFLSVVFSSYDGTTIYHTVAIAFLSFIWWYYYNNHLRVKNRSSQRTLIGFSLLLAAHIIFMIDYPIFYFLGEIAIILGFAILLYNQIKLQNTRP